jgi:CRISPR/Cas system CSM-associated protein Csm3 (group 7 of RAMP superfamily)
MGYSGSKEVEIKNKCNVEITNVRLSHYNSKPVTELCIVKEIQTGASIEQTFHSVPNKSDHWSVCFCIGDEAFMSADIDSDLKEKRNDYILEIHKDEFVMRYNGQIQETAKIQGIYDFMRRIK